MRRKKIEKHVEKIVKELVTDLHKTDVWVLLHTLENDMQFVRPKVEELESVVNTIWGLPMFKPYRGKK
jgi:hypothetical protein